MGFTCFIEVRRLKEWIRIDHGVSEFEGRVGESSTIVSIFRIRFVSRLSFRITCS